MITTFEHYNITKIIEQLVIDMKLSPRSIIHGQCGEFVTRLLDFLGGEKEDVFALSTNSFDDNEGWGFSYDDSSDKRYYLKFGPPPKGISIGNLQFIDHAWLYYKGKHYDALTKNGVNNYKDLHWFRLNLDDIKNTFDDSNNKTI